MTEPNTPPAGSLDPKLLEMLACPACKGTLDHRTEPESLDCSACRLRFRVEDGIPIMLIDEAQTLSEDGDDA